MFISEFIKQDEMEKWPLGSNVLIEAQTGAGKSTWIFNELARFCDQKGWKVLVLSNRSMLKIQNIKCMATNNIRCENYQFLETMNLSLGAKCLAEYQVVCFDEYHYIFKDSQFNSETKRTLDYLANNKNKSIGIFLSATPIPLEDLGFHFGFRYKLPEDFSFIEHLYLFNEMDDALRVLTQKPVREKSICFISNAKYGAMLAQKNPSQFALICSETNKYYSACDKFAMLNISTRNKFDSQILLATSVLDNGVSIKSKATKNVIIEYYDPISIIQMLGRKRITPGEKIDLYLKMPTKYYIAHQANLCASEETSCSGHYSRFLRAYYCELKEKGYARYWAERFSLPEAKVIHLTNSDDMDRLKRFLKNNVGKKLKREVVLEKMEKVMEGATKKKVGSLNKFLVEHKIDYEIKVARKTENKQKKTKWIICTK